MKKIPFSSAFLFLAIGLAAQDSGETSVTNTVIRDGVSLGSVLAMVTSWSRSKSVLWAILHALLSWFYVIYFVLTRQPADKENG